MNIQFPIRIENSVGERIIFKSFEPDTHGGRVLIQGFCRKGCGPAMHTHFLQDEELKVVSGKMAYQILGSAVQEALPGETVLFKRGTPHKFWALDGDLQIEAIVSPAHSIIYFLSAVYKAQLKSGKAEPDPFDAAYLLTRYASEYDMPEIPTFFKRVIFPITVFIGKILGKYPHFRDAPEPVGK